MEILFERFVVYTWFTDIDNCDAGLGTCTSNARCVDQVGRFECHCIEGYTGNGSTYCNSELRW